MMFMQERSIGLEREGSISSIIVGLQNLTTCILGAGVSNACGLEGYRTGRDRELRKFTVRAAKRRANSAILSLRRWRFAVRQMPKSTARSCR
jgi:hypothetical protein